MRLHISNVHAYTNQLHFEVCDYGNAILSSYKVANHSYKIREEYLSAVVGQQQPSYNISFSVALLDLIQILSDCPRPSLTASKLVGDQLP